MGVAHHVIQLPEGKSSIRNSTNSFFLYLSFTDNGGEYT